MSDLTVERYTYVTTGSESGATTVASFTDGKGIFMQVMYGEDGSPSSTNFSYGHMYATPADGSVGIFVSFGTGGQLGRYVGAGNVNDDLWIFGTDGSTPVVQGDVTMTSTTLEVDFTTTEAGHTFEILLFKGPAELEVTLWEALLTDTSVDGAPSEPNLVFATTNQIGAPGVFAGSGGSNRFAFGFCANDAGTPDEASIVSMFDDQTCSNGDTILSWAVFPQIPRLDITSFNADGFNCTGAGGGGVAGLMIQTNGDVAVTSHIKADTVTTSDTESLPDAGFDNVGLVMVASCARDHTLTVEGGLAMHGVGVCTDSGSTHHYASRIGSAYACAVEDGVFTKGADNSSNTYEGTIPGPDRQPTITWVDASAFNLRINLLYVEVASAAVATDPVWIPMVM